MEWLHLLLGFFLANALGYGGGPASIPLMYREIVTHYGWLNDSQFSNMLALGNTLPGPIATKIAAYVGFQISGTVGLMIALAATSVPSAVALIGLISLLHKYRASAAVKGMTLLVQPVIAVMMIVLAWQLADESLRSIGIWQALGIAAVAWWTMAVKKWHPAFVIVAAFVYGGVKVLVI